MIEKGTYLIMGDIHGNLPALEQLLKIEQDIDGIVCHGDVVNYGPWSNECVQLLASIRSCICLRGNHEDAFSQGAYFGTSPLVKKFFSACFENFSEHGQIATYLDETTIGSYKIQHTLNNEYIFKDTPLSKPAYHSIIGHSHQQFNRVIEGINLYNTGSVGQNRSYINVSEYLIFDLQTNEVFLKNFICNIDLVINQMKSLNYPEECIQYYESKKRA
jgi:predicted phosphodiesterase